jgi:hypothetical protein
MTQPKVIALNNGQLTDFAVDRLFRLLAARAGVRYQRSSLPQGRSAGADGRLVGNPICLSELSAWLLAVPRILGLLRSR